MRWKRAEAVGERRSGIFIRRLLKIWRWQRISQDRRILSSRPPIFPAKNAAACWRLSGVGMENFWPVRAIRKIRRVKIRRTLKSWRMGRSRLLPNRKIRRMKSARSVARPMVVKTGRFGKFLACSAYPECKTTKPIPWRQMPSADWGRSCPEAYQERAQLLFV